MTCFSVCAVAHVYIIWMFLLILFRRTRLPMNWLWSRTTLRWPPSSLTFVRMGLLHWPSMRREGAHIGMDREESRYLIYCTAK